MGRLHRSPAATLARAGLVGLLGLGAAACATGGGGGRVADYRPANLRPYEVNGRRYSPRVDDHYEQKGLASWYSYPAGTRRTASGEPFDGHSIAGAHKTLPLPCIVEVTNLENGRKLRVRINDRGPVRGRADHRPDPRRGRPPGLPRPRRRQGQG
ncbi:MAG: RlpA-like double-psi beta-barrel domain-containing protein [Caulobacteraceae bacterium]